METDLNNSIQEDEEEKDGERKCPLLASGSYLSNNVFAIDPLDKDSSSILKDR